MWIDSGSSGFQDNFTCQIFFFFLFCRRGEASWLQFLYQMLLQWIRTFIWDNWGLALAFTLFIACKHSFILWYLFYSWEVIGSPTLNNWLSVSHFLSTLTRQSDVKRTLTLVFRTILSTEKELWTCAHLLYFNLLGLYACIVLYFLLVKFEFLHLKNINLSFVWN